MRARKVTCWKFQSPEEDPEEVCPGQWKWLGVDDILLLITDLYSRVWSWKQEPNLRQKKEKKNCQEKGKVTFPHLPSPSPWGLSVLDQGPPGRTRLDRGGNSSEWTEGKQRFQGLGHGSNNFGQNCLIPHFCLAVSAVLLFFRMGSLKRQNLDNNLCRRKAFKVYVKKHRLAGGGKSYPSPALNFLSPVHRLYFLHCLIYTQSFSQTQFLVLTFAAWQERPCPGSWS